MSSSTELKTDIQEYKIHSTRQTTLGSNWLKDCYLFFMLWLAAIPALANNWQDVAPGIQYIDLHAHLLTPWSHIHIFKVDLNENQLDLVMANHLSQPNASTDEFIHHSQGLIAINGGFFDQHYRPLGLRISNQRQFNPLKRISWWGIFYVKSNKPYLTSWREYPSNSGVAFALQSGPRLLVQGKIPSLKPGVAERTALGITPEGKVIILVTENSPMTTTALAQLMKEAPLHCENALNLDGGSSTQVTANMDDFQMNVHGFSNVSDAIVVKRRAR